MKQLFFTAAIIVSISGQSIAQDRHDHGHDDHNKKLSIHADTKTYFTSIYEANESEEEISDIFTHSHIEGKYKINKNYSINGTALLEGDPAGHSHGGEISRSGDHFFDDHPMFIEQLTFNYDDKNYGAFVGKFNPNIGIDAHDVPGWFGTFVFEDFKISEKLGFGGHATFNGHRLDASTFFADTSFLQQSLLYNRDDLKESDGGISNTEDLSSFSIQLSGAITDNNNLNYYFGHAKQANDIGDDENRFTFGLQGHHKFNSVNINPMIDVTDINHLSGEDDHDRTYITVGLGASIQDWNWGTTYTKIDNKSSNKTEGMDGSILQTSIGYDIGYGFGVDVGYHRQNTEGETSKRLGSLLKYSAEF